MQGRIVALLEVVVAFSAGSRSKGLPLPTVCPRSRRGIQTRVGRCSHSCRRSGTIIIGMDRFFPLTHTWTADPAQSFNHSDRTPWRAPIPCRRWSRRHRPCLHHNSQALPRDMLPGRPRCTQRAPSRATFAQGFRASRGNLCATHEEAPNLLKLAIHWMTRIMVLAPPPSLLRSPALTPGLPPNGPTFPCLKIQSLLWYLVVRDRKSVV